MTFSPKI